MKSMYNPTMDNFFVTNGITFRAESDLEYVEAGAEPHTFDVQSIDIIYNPEYEAITRKYKLPVFFKSNLDDENRETY
jgi:hypothetical protein